MTVRGVLFDMDGLLVDTATAYFECGVEVFRRRGKSFTEEHGQRITGMTTLRAMELLGEEFDLSESPEKLAHDYEGLFAQKQEEGLRLMPGAREVLERLERNGIPKALATSAFRIVAQRNMEHFNLTAYFAFVLASEDVTHGKPHPMIYQKGCERLGLPPAEVLVLEDSLHGTLAAKAAGCQCIAVPSRFTRTLNFSSADAVVDSLLDAKVYEMIGL